MQVIFSKIELEISPFFTVIQFCSNIVEKRVGKSPQESSTRPTSRNILTNFKGRLQSLLRMCDRFVMRSLLITSFQSHGVNENTRGRLNRSLLYCKERWRIKPWHNNCCFESFKIKQLILDSGNAANCVA